MQLQNHHSLRVMAPRELRQSPQLSEKPMQQLNSTVTENIKCGSFNTHHHLLLNNGKKEIPTLWWRRQPPSFSSSQVKSLGTPDLNHSLNFLDYSRVLEIWNPPVRAKLLFRTRLAIGEETVKHMVIGFSHMPHRRRNRGEREDGKKLSRKRALPSEKSSALEKERNQKSGKGRRVC